MAAIPQGAFAACKVRYNEKRAISMSVMEGKEKTSKENIFNSRPPLEGNSCPVNIIKETSCNDCKIKVSILGHTYKPGHSYYFVKHEYLNDQYRIYVYIQCMCIFLSNLNIRI